MTRTLCHSFSPLLVALTDLSRDITEHDLLRVFEAWPVCCVRIVRDCVTNKSLGYAFVEFHRADDGACPLRAASLL